MHSFYRLLPIDLILGPQAPPAKSGRAPQGEITY